MLNYQKLLQNDGSFTNVTIPETILAVQERLIENDNWKTGRFGKILVEDIICLLTACLKNTYFQYNNELFLQTEGCPMGSPISGTVADIYLQKLEKHVVSLYPKILFWKRYVDDVFAIIEGDENDANEIKNQLNLYHPNIQFTMEVEKNREIAFLDIIIKRTLEGGIETRVFRKETHTDRYLNFKSFHHKSQKISVIDSLVYRAFKISSPIHLQNELDHITEVLTQNSFPLNFINTRILRMKNKFDNQNSISTQQNSIQTTNNHFQIDREQQTNIQIRSPNINIQNSTTHEEKKK